MKVIVPLAPGFEEIETMAIVDILRRAEIEVYLAGTTEPPVASARDVKVIPDILIDDVTDYDAIVLPGGNPGYMNLAGDERVLKLVKDAYKKGKYVAAICAAPSILGKAGIMEGITATHYPGIDVIGAKYTNERVTRDGIIITSQGPGTAIDFALFLVEIFVGKTTSETIREAMLA
ncbi:MAG TPA: DJ-1 family glyoxalase III [Candidatus Acidoferrales bacterium]|nr:DJ-1 family glyoxalase III [Candidatus Acidoferrales bacterium]